MSTILKQCVGIDASKDELMACFGQLDQQLATQLKSTRNFINDEQGIDGLIEWADQLSDQKAKLVFVVEATGVYHEKLAYQLYHQGRDVCVVLANKANYFAKTLKVRSVTDLLSSKTLARMGLEKQLELWEPPHQFFAELKQLTREHKRLKEEVTVLKNQLHAAEVAVQTLPGSVNRIQQRLQMCLDHIGQIEVEIRSLIAKDEHIRQRFEAVCTIKGVGLMTAAVVVSEANGFHMVRNVRQLVCYAGYDIVDKQSGTSVKGKPRISKKGNSYIRRALYFPAIVAVRDQVNMEEFFERLHGRHGIKMKAYTAVQRKLLVLIYTLWTKQQKYDPKYNQKKVGQLHKAALQELT